MRRELFRMNGATMASGHKDNKVTDLTFGDGDFGVIWCGQDWLRIKGLTARNIVDNSSGANPPHAY